MFIYHIVKGWLIMTNQIKAAIDIGSNSIRLLIARVNKNGLEELYRDVQTTRLGEGIQHYEKLTQRSINDSVHVLKEYYQIIHQYQVNETKIVATSAIREASNNQEFFNEVNRAIAQPINIEVVDGIREAALNYKGATMELTEDAFVFDLGGGSLEIIPQDPNSMASFPIGAVKATESYCDEEGRIRNHEDLRKAVQKIITTEILSAYQENIQVVGVGGTATYLAKAYKKLPVYKKEDIHGTYLSRTDLNNLLKGMEKYDLEQRVDEFFLTPNRADIIIAGGYIINYLLQEIGAKGYWASDNDMLMGLILEI